MRGEIRRRGRVLIAKPGLDGHSKGAKIITMVLRNAGFEVIYTGLHQSVDAIIMTAIQEDVDIIGLSILSGAHLPICEKLMEKVRNEGLENMKIVVGGNIPAQDFSKLEGIGISEIFPSGTKFDVIINKLTQLIGT